MPSNTLWRDSRHLSPQTARSPRSPRRPARLGTRLGAGVAAVTASAGLLVGAAPATADNAAPTQLLSQGSAGRAVAKVQRALHISATGRFGASTRRAVLAFQRKDRLMVDGIVGPQTWDTLFHIAPSASTAGASGSTAYSATGGYSIPASIVACESGGDYSAVNPSSGAGGAYQILPSTWQAYGGQGLPEDASPAEQNQIAAEIYAADGPSAWTC